MLDQSKSYAFDSRKIMPGDAFICLPNGDRYIEDALHHGATEIVHLTRPDFAMAAHDYFGDPTKRVKLIGITGTNGKTSVSAFTAQLLRSLGYKVLVIGTLQASLTTPESWEALKKIKEHADDGGTHVVMEVSSHGIDQHRVDGFCFDIKCLTNITQDHLDYHGTFENYKQTKLRFMSDWPGKTVFLKDVELISPGLIPQLRGSFHLKNVSMALHICNQLGELPDQLMPQLGELIAPLGRFQAIDVGQQFEVVIDFAHTPDALEHVLDDAFKICNNDRSRVRLVMGCGGERDKTKRQKMGQIAEKYAQNVYLTADNPRSESTLQIVQDIAAGMTGAQSINQSLLDRRLAISAAIQDAQPNDLILIVGKGHETMQHCKGFSYGFNDADISLSELINQGYCQCTPCWGLNTPNSDVLFISKKTAFQFSEKNHQFMRTLPAPSNTKIQEYMAKLHGRKVIVIESENRTSLAGIMMCALRSIGRGKGYWFDEKQSLQYNLVGLTLIDQTDDPIIIKVGAKFIRNARQIIQLISPDYVVIGDVLSNDGFVKNQDSNAIRRAIDQPIQAEWWYSNELIDIADLVDSMQHKIAIKIQSNGWVDYMQHVVEQMMNRLGFFIHSPRLIVQNQLMAKGWFSKVLIESFPSPVYFLTWLGDRIDAMQKMAYFFSNAPVLFCMYAMPNDVQKQLEKLNKRFHSRDLLVVANRDALSVSIRSNPDLIHVLWVMESSIPTVMGAFR